jgi:hypothetical protein
MSDFLSACSSQSGLESWPQGCPEDSGYGHEIEEMESSAGPIGRNTVLREPRLRLAQIGTEDPNPSTPRAR